MDAIGIDLAPSIIVLYNPVVGIWLIHEARKIDHRSGQKWQIVQTLIAEI